MKISFLDFESPIAELEDKIEQLRYVQDDSALDIADEISRLSKKSEALTKDVYGKLSSWQISQVSRHPSVLIPWTTSMRCLLISSNCTVTVRLPMTRRSWAVWRDLEDRA